MQRVKTHVPAPTPISAVSPIVALRGKLWLEQTLNAVIGMWRDRGGLDAVAWQRKLRSEWDRNAVQRVRPSRSKRSG